MPTWTRWRPFPDPRRAEMLHAPIGPGVYELRHRQTGKLILVGIGKNTAQRMSSLMPQDKGGTGGRNNSAKRTYVVRHVDHIEYRTLATYTRSEAAAVERACLGRNEYRFST